MRYCLLLLFQNFSEYGMSLPVTDFGLQSLMQTAMLPQRPGETACAVLSPRNLYIFACCTVIDKAKNQKSHYFAKAQFDDEFALIIVVSCLPF